MQSTLLKSLLAEGITDFAITPVSVERQVSSYYQNIKNLKNQCPRGLIRATVIKTGHEWEEEITFGCGGDKTHKQKRRNGVLVEFPLSFAQKKDEKIEDTEKRAKKLKHHEVVERDGQKFVQLNSTHKAIVVPWGEYAMVEAEREKKDQEREARNSVMRAALNTINAPQNDDNTALSGSFEFNDRTYYDDKESRRAEEKKERAEHAKNADFVEKHERWGHPVTAYLYGRVEIPLKHAQKIGEGLDLLRQALGSGQLRDTIVGEQIEKFLADFDKNTEKKDSAKNESTA